MKKPSKRSMIKKCDIAWAIAVKVIAGYKCQICGSVYTLNSHHIIGRINYSLRFDLKNGICACVSCHKFSTNSIHNNPLKFMEWFEIMYPENYEYLRTKKNVIAKYLDYEAILKDLKDVIDELQ